MNQLSDRLNRLSPSATLAMSQKSSELKAQGVDVINLSQMFSLGLTETVHQILKQLPSLIQTCLFSATLSPEILQLAEITVHDPLMIQIDSPRQTNQNVHLTSLTVQESEKMPFSLRNSAVSAHFPAR